MGIITLITCSARLTETIVTKSMSPYPSGKEMITGLTCFSKTLMSRGHSYRSNGKSKHIEKHQQTAENKSSILDHKQDMEEGVRKKKENENEEKGESKEQTNSFDSNQN